MVSASPDVVGLRFSVFGTSVPSVFSFPCSVFSGDEQCCRGRAVWGKGMRFAEHWRLKTENFFGVLWGINQGIDIPRSPESSFFRGIAPGPFILPEATPVHEVAQLQRDLRRAEIEPFAWVINNSLSPLNVTDSLLAECQRHEAKYVLEVVTDHASRTVLIEWQREPPVGPEALKRPMQSEMMMA